MTKTLLEKCILKVPDSFGNTLHTIHTESIIAQSRSRRPYQSALSYVHLRIGGACHTPSICKQITPNEKTHETFQKIPKI